MPLLKFMYDDREEYVKQIGNKTYIFDPTCPVDDPDDVKYFLGLKPQTFVVVDGPEDLTCDLCDYEAKNARALRMHKMVKHRKKDVNAITDKE